MLAEPLPALDPVAVAARLCGEDGFVWLDSAASGHPASRHSYIGVWPVDRIALDGIASASKHLRAWIGRFSADRVAGGAPFQGGVVGYFSYDFAPAFVDRIRLRHARTSLPALEFAFYDTVIAFDHTSGEATVYAAGLGEMSAGESIRKLREILSTYTPPPSAPPPVDWRAQSGSESYKKAVRRTQDYIRDGDVYQANIAGLWNAPPQARAEAFAQYMSIRPGSPAPFGAFGVFPGRTLASFSPERLIALDGAGRVKAEPIKGTIRRGQTDEEDRKLRAELAGSEKDRAENIMIVDLLRNDMSRVCTSSSVTVSSLCRLETYSNLHHLVSTIEGDLAPDEDAISLLQAVFPGGSITGAPKLRAMEIIDELEPEARGVFCGSLGWIGFDGAMDFSILIRTIEHVPKETRLWAGAGITLLSDPDTEYDEICLKAARIMSAAPGRVAAT
ncbi:aminodeoxychorismate synthase component I [Hyphomonas sp. WL0036]|uniref:aminodeoxychorismate synthase component I n=1 Tax=Hyphomonas sediminis TaxID=2866160 RepID=UPI001C7F003A|nr:aminodeoxychorismate synthase component I [Hyphomonas sediminis]MBY9068033.1 aminodeoxychorismate synthase component I [Hyphomonas sediminis]